MLRDIIIIGGGPAGLSAAINARIRNKNVLVISNDFSGNGLSKAEKIDNYLGMPGLSGKELMDAFLNHAESLGVEIINKRVLTVMHTGPNFFVSFDNEVQGAKSLIIASGTVPTGKLKGEAALLGKGVSYCATCDGMLYRGRRVVVTGSATDAVSEANYLSEIGCEVLFISAKKPEEKLDDKIQHIKAAKIEVLGGEKVSGVVANGEEIACEGVFVLRPSIAPQDFMPTLETEGGFIKTGKLNETNVKGVFAAGDCAGRPLQVAKAVGEGQAAAYHCVEYLDAIPQ